MADQEGAESKYTTVQIDRESHRRLQEFAKQNGFGARNLVGRFVQAGLDALDARDVEVLEQLAPGLLKPELGDDHQFRLLLVTLLLMAGLDHEESVRIAGLTK